MAVEGNRITRSISGPPWYNEPTVGGFIATLSGIAFTPTGMNLFNTDDELRLTLATGDAPVATNGTWSKKTGNTLWLRRFHPAWSSADGPDVQSRAQFRILLLRSGAQGDGLLCQSNESARVGPA